MAIIEFVYKARCKHCAFCASYFKGKRKLHKCMKNSSDNYWSFKEVEEFDGESVTLKDYACKEFKLG